MPVAETVTELLRPVVDMLGVELIDVEWVGSSLRVVVDEGDGITTDRLAEVNRVISPILDQHDPVPGRYTLEVSSPGVERKLTRPDHFTRAIGENVIVKLHAGADPRRIKGSLVAFADDTLSVDAIELDGIDLDVPETHQVSLAEVDKARTVFDWGPAPKPGGKKKPGPKPSGAGKKPNAKNAGQDRERSDAGEPSSERSEDPGHE